MTTADAVRYLRRFQQWRRGVDEKTMEEASLDPKKTGEALDAVLEAVTAMSRTLASTQSQLAKCRIQRERFHSQLRSKRGEI